MAWTVVWPPETHDTVNATKLTQNFRKLCPMDGFYRMYNLNIFKVTFKWTEEQNVLKLHSFLLYLLLYFLVWLHYKFLALPVDYVSLCVTVWSSVYKRLILIRVYNTVQSSRSTLLFFTHFTDSMAAWRKNRKKWGLNQDFCSVFLQSCGLCSHVSWYLKCSSWCWDNIMWLWNVLSQTDLSSSKLSLTFLYSQKDVGEVRLLRVTEFTRVHPFLFWR